MTSIIELQPGQVQRSAVYEARKHIKTLNAICPFYNSYFGFHPREENDDMPTGFVQVKKKHFEVFHELGANFYAVENPDFENAFNDSTKCVSTYMYRDSHGRPGLVPDEVINRIRSATFEVQNLESISKLALPYSRIEIRLPGDWEQKPDCNQRGYYWYDRPSEWWGPVVNDWKHKNHWLRKYALPNLRSKSYVRVETAFEIVSLDREEKGTDLTYADILFATRALCCDDTRTAEKYRIVSNTENGLTLQVQIDNWST